MTQLPVESDNFTVLHSFCSTVAGLGEIDARWAVVAERQPGYHPDYCVSAWEELGRCAPMLPLPEYWRSVADVDFKEPQWALLLEPKMRFAAEIWAAAEGFGTGLEALHQCFQECFVSSKGVSLLSLMPLTNSKRILPVGHFRPVSDNDREDLNTWKRPRTLLLQTIVQAQGGPRVVLFCGRKHFRTWLTIAKLDSLHPMRPVTGLEEFASFVWNNGKLFVVLNDLGRAPEGCSVRLGEWIASVNPHG